MEKNDREKELWDKWMGGERLHADEIEEAFARGVGFKSEAMPEDDPRWPRFRLLWSKAVRFRNDASAMSQAEVEEAIALGIRIVAPLPSEKEIEDDARRIALLKRHMKGEEWTGEDCQEAVSCGLTTREQVIPFLAVIKAVRQEGYEPIFGTLLECSTVHIRYFPRTPDEGYEIPSLLDDVTYRGGGMDFADVDAPSGRQWVKWIGKHKSTGQLVAHTRDHWPGSELEYVALWER